MNSSAPAAGIPVTPGPCHPERSGVEVSKRTDKGTLRVPTVPRQDRLAPSPGWARHNQGRDNRKTSRGITDGQQRNG